MLHWYSGHRVWGGGGDTLHWYSGHRVWGGGRGHTALVQWSPCVWGGDTLHWYSGHRVGGGGGDTLHWYSGHRVCGGEGTRCIGTVVTVCGGGGGGGTALGTVLTVWED